MKRLLVSLVLLMGCGDDLGWSAPDPDCPDPGVVDVQDSQDIDDVADSDGGVDVDDGDVADVGGVEDLGVGGDAAQDVTEVVDADQTPDLPDAQTQVDDVEAADVQDTDLPTQDSVSIPPECTETSDCPAPACVIASCDEGKCHQDKQLLDGMPCDLDGDVCTLEKCLDGKCLTAGTKYCDDQVACTVDSCVDPIGCQHLIDGSVCQDNNVCTDDSCDPKVGCLNLPNQATCTDGIGCTDGDACQAGQCLPGDPTSCDDLNPCTSDICDVLSDCVNEPNTATCTDQNACTEQDVCAQAVCLGVPATCTDGNVCTADECAPTTGCLNLPIPATCTDGSACTKDDACIQGACVSTQIVCDDKNECTLDSCAPQTGCFTTPLPNGTKCGGGACSNGTCTCLTGFGCAAPKFQYSGDVTAGMLGGMGGNVGPKMGCATTDILIGVGFDFSTNTQTATRTTIVCGTVTSDQSGNVTTTQTTTQKNGGSGCYGWDPSTPTPLTKCPVGWAIVGIKGKNAGTTLFNTVDIVCQKLGVGGGPVGPTQTIPVPGMVGSGSATAVSCPTGTIARYFETRAGCGQDALTLYCAKATPDCTGQPLICKD